MADSETQTTNDFKKEFEFFKEAYSNFLDFFKNIDVPNSNEYGTVDFMPKGCMNKMYAARLSLQLLMAKFPKPDDMTEKQEDEWCKRRFEGLLRYLQAVI